MSMKKILMAAAAVTALTAGSASAATVSPLSKVGGKFLTPTGVTGTTFDAYTIANELNVAPTAPTADATIVIAPTSNTTIGAGQYVLTYNITGGTFTTTSVSSAASSITLKANNSSGTDIASPSSQVTSVAMVNANTVAFNITVASGEFLTNVSLINTLKLGQSRTAVAIDGNLTTAGGSSVDGGAIASKTIIDYRAGYKFSATAADATLTLKSGYKKFTVGTDASSFDIGTGIGFAINSNAATDNVYIKTDGTTAQTSDLLTPAVTLTGDVSAFDPTVGSQAPDTGTTNVFTLTSLTAIRGATEKVTLTQRTTPLVGNASAYSITPTVTMASGYTAPTFANTPIGTVSLEGTNFYAAWVGDGTNGITYSIRLGNRSATAVSAVTVAVLNSLNPATVATCNMGAVPASGELLITSASLKTCFGSFGRADLRITAQVSSSSLTAKMRSVAAGVVNEQSLGGGSDVAKAN